MLKTRIIPILLTDGRGNVVKPIRFQRPYRIVGNLMQHIRVLEKRNVDELILLDIEATNEGRLIDAERIKDYTKELYCPVTLGGGIKSLDDINRLLNAGADKVTINSSFQSQWSLVENAAVKFGSQAIVVSVDCAQHKDYISPFTKSGKFRIKYSPLEWCKSAEEQGAGEILLTSIDKEGTLSGYEFALNKAVCSYINIPVIVNGGCGSVDHMAAALRAGAHAVAAGSLFLFTDTTPKQCSRELQKMGFNTRVE